MKKTVDVLVERSGGIFLFSLFTPESKVWVKENVGLESWHWTGKYSFGVEHRFAKSLSDGMQEAGLFVQ